MSTSVRPPCSLASAKENPDYFEKEVPIVADLCTDTDGTPMDEQSLSNRTEEESVDAASNRIKICWFEEFSRLANADRPDDMKTFTYLEDF